ncbi:MAG: hypothetical protein B7Y97_06920 [Sphingomonas sp. 32-66-10]|nr:MAG: hypothetical protein B7Y97_06920 [Sphingomonas sp. 32-66-10]
MKSVFSESLILQSATRGPPDPLPPPPPPPPPRSPPARPPSVPSSFLVVRAPEPTFPFDPTVIGLRSSARRFLGHSFAGSLPPAPSTLRAVSG